MRNCVAFLTAVSLFAGSKVLAEIPFEAQISAVEPKVVAWRRDIHQHPELGNREFRTASLVAEHLQRLGIQTTTGIAHTGVVGVLVGGRPGPVVALRADMDALPVTERIDLPFASKVRTEYAGAEVGVMHACGHDAHVAILMGVAEVLAGQREQLAGTVKFIFQPAEEGAPEGEEGGAELMVREGVLSEPAVDVIFGLHVSSIHEVGTIVYRPGGALASAEAFRITVDGAQAHGASPWMGVDPVLASAHIVTALQSIVSRNVNLLDAAAVVTVGSIHGGNRSNIIPEQVRMEGTLRALTPDARELLRTRLVEVSTQVGEGMGARVQVEVPFGVGYPVTFNDPDLTARMLPSLQRVAGADRTILGQAITGAEDFSFFAEKVPGLFFFLGGRPSSVAKEDAPSHHTPEFYIDDSGLGLGVRALVALTLDYAAGAE